MSAELRPELPSPLVALDDERFSRYGVRLWLKRDDLIHSDIPGNKWRKLIPNLEVALEQGHSRLLTFGGAFSNHIAATAAAGPLFGLETIGVIRGEEHLPLNPVLAGAVANGMHLIYLDRSTYRQKHTSQVIERLLRQYGDCSVVPEGGSNALAVQSCRAIPGEITEGFDVIACPMGTGGTLAGLAGGLQKEQSALGFSALRGGEFLIREVEALQRAAFGSGLGDWRIECGYSFGGFAKRTSDLDQFIDDFRGRHGITLEWVYVAKMLYGLVDLAGRGAFPEGTRVVAVITG